MLDSSDDINIHTWIPKSSSEKLEHVTEQKGTPLIFSIQNLKNVKVERVRKK